MGNSKNSPDATAMKEEGAFLIVIPDGESGNWSDFLVLVKKVTVARVLHRPITQSVFDHSAPNENWRRLRCPYGVSHT
jgi:hypothetical protein